MMKNILLFSILVFILFKPPTDPDFWWHLKYGEFISTTHSIPHTNFYSYTMPNYAWANSYWLSQVIMYLAFRIGNFLFIPLVLAILLSISLVFISKNLDSNFFSKALALILVSIGFALFDLSARPMLFSTIFLYILWWILLFNNKRKYFYFIPLIFLLWVNMHADFVIGLCVLSAFNLYEFILFLKKQIAFKLVILNALILITSFVLTFINPYTSLLHITLFKEILSMPSQSKNIAEFTPINFESSRTVFIYAISVLSLVFWVLFYKAGKNSHIFNIIFPKKLLVLLTLIPVALYSIRSVYFLRIFLVLSTPIIFLFFYELESAFKNLFTQNYSRKPFIFGLALFYSIFLFMFLENLSKSTNLRDISSYGKYPFDAVRFLKSNPQSGNMFNEYAWGGYLIWNYPMHKTFIDGRMPAWEMQGSRIFEEYRLLGKNKNMYYTSDIFSKHNVSFALLPKKSKFLEHLKTDLRWETVYSDEAAEVVKKPLVYN